MIDTFPSTPVLSVPVSVCKSNYYTPIGFNDSDEKATFIKKMASCKVYEVVYSPFTEVKNFYLYTKFDNNPVKKYAFGKTDGIADFSHLKRAQRM